MNCGEDWNERDHLLPLSEGYEFDRCLIMPETVFRFCIQGFSNLWTFYSQRRQHWTKRPHLPVGCCVSVKANGTMSLAKWDCSHVQSYREYKVGIFISLFDSGLVAGSRIHKDDYPSHLHPSLTVPRSLTKICKSSIECCGFLRLNNINACRQRHSNLYCASLHCKPEVWATCEGSSIRLLMPI